MRQDDLSDDLEDTEHPPEERARAGTRRTRGSAAANAWHLEAEESLTVEAGHAAAVPARTRVLDLVAPMAIGDRRAASDLR